jgi:hypothetical protein
LASTKRPSYSVSSFSRIGPSALHGPVASYLTGAQALTPAQRDGVHAEVARLASRWLAR